MEAMTKSIDKVVTEAGTGSRKRGWMRRFLDWLARGGESYAVTGCGQ